MISKYIVGTNYQGIQNILLIHDKIQHETHWFDIGPYLSTIELTKKNKTKGLIICFHYRRVLKLAQAMLLITLAY